MLTKIHFTSRRQALRKMKGEERAEQLHSEDSFYHSMALLPPSAIRLAYISYKVKYGVRILDIFMCRRMGGMEGTQYV